MHKLMCMTENWWDYVLRVSAHATSVDIADKSGLTPSAITRWKQGDVPRAENAIAFARAYNRPPKEALVIAWGLRERSPGPTGWRVPRNTH